MGVRGGRVGVIVAALAAAGLVAAALAPRAPVLADAGCRERYSCTPDGLPTQGATPHRLILFTFDDGPDPRTTPRLLTMLDELQVKALFFMVGWRLAPGRRGAEERGEIARQVLARGHAVGSHGFDHVRLDRLSQAELDDQLDRSEAAFTRIFGGKPTFFRPPHGMRSARVDASLAARGYTTMNWNLNPTDYSVRDPESVLRNFERVLAARERRDGQRGGVVLLHDTHEWSLEGFRRIHAMLSARNCELAQRGEELYDMSADPRLFYEPRRGRAVGTAAPPLTLAREALAERQGRLRQATLARCGQASSTPAQPRSAAWAQGLENPHRSAELSGVGR